MRILSRTSTIPLSYTGMCVWELPSHFPSRETRQFRRRETCTRQLLHFPPSPYLIFSSHGAPVRHLARRRRRWRMLAAKRNRRIRIPRCQPRSRNDSVQNFLRFLRAPLNNFSDAFRNRGKLERSTNRSKVKNRTSWKKRLDFNWFRAIRSRAKLEGKSNLLVNYETMERGRERGMIKDN